MATRSHVQRNRTGRNSDKQATPAQGGSVSALKRDLKAAGDTGGFAAQEAMLAPSPGPVQRSPAPVGPVQLKGAGNGSLLATVQAKLLELGFDPGAADGIMGPRTSAAIRAFQQARGLGVDGIVGPETLGALGLSGGGGGAQPGKSPGGAGAAGTSVPPPPITGDAAPGPSGAAPSGKGAPAPANSTSGEKKDEKEDGESGLGGTEIEVGVKAGGKDVGISGGLSENGKSVVGQVGTGKSLTVAQNVCGPIYVSGAIGCKFVVAGSAGQETGSSFKGSVSAELRLGVGAAQMAGEHGFEIGAGGELRGQVEVIPIGASFNTESGWKFEAFTATVDVGLNGYVMVQVDGVGPKLTIPARKYQLYEVTGGRYENGTLTSFTAREGPGMAQLKADIAAVLDQAKAGANKVADFVDEHAPKSVKDDTANVVSYLIEGRSEDERKADEASAAAATAASWESFRSWWQGHRATLTAQGIPMEKRNQIFDLYERAWKYANPGDSEVAPNLSAAQGLRAQAKQLEQTEAKAAQQKAKQAGDDKKAEVPEAKKLEDIPLPGAIRGEVKHRVENHQMSGSIPYAGVTYAFSYDKGSRTIAVTAPGAKPQTVAYTPPWM